MQAYVQDLRNRAGGRTPAFDGGQNSSTPFLRVRENGIVVDQYRPDPTGCATFFIVQITNIFVDRASNAFVKILCQKESVKDWKPIL